MFWFSTSSKSGSDASELDAELSNSRLILWLTATILAVFFGWAYFFEINQVSRAQGAIMPSSNVQIIQSQDGGVIRTIKVSAGDQVRRGDTMIELDDTSVKADLREAEAKAAGLSASLALGWKTCRRPWQSTSISLWAFHQPVRRGRFFLRTMQR